MIPATYPSKLDENNTTQMVVYYLSSVSGLERWKDYIPVKETPLSSPELNSFNTNGAIYTTALSSIVGKQAWVDYIPVYEDSLATDAWTINAVGYLTTKSEVVAKALAVIASYGTDAHVYLPGIGVINGLTAGNYLDSAGTTAATVDNPVGLVLDAAGSVGAELVTNGDFSNGTTGWTLGANTNISSGTLNVTGAELGSFATQAPSVPSGKAYRVSYTISANNGQLSANIGGTNGIATAIGQTGTFSEIIVSAGVSSIGFTVRGVGVSSAVIDNFSVKEVTGIHATQGTTANKPILRRGAVNLLLQSNNILNTPWTLIAGATRAAGQITFAASASSAIENLCLIPGGTANKTITVAAKVSCSSGTVPFRLKNSQAGVVDNLSPELLATTTPTVFVFTVTNGASAGNGSQNFGITNSAVTPVVNTLNFEIAGVFIGTYTADSLISSGGLVATTTAPASSASGNYKWEFDGTNDSLALGSVPFQIADNFAVIFGASFTNIVGDKRVFALRTGANMILCGIAGANLDFFLRDNASVGSRIIVDGTTVVNTPFVYGARRISGTNIVRRNGVTKGTDSTVLGASTISGGAIGYDNNSLYAACSVYPIIAIKGTVTDADMLILEKWVGSLSGVNVP